MRQLQPATPATLEAARWWLGELREALPPETPVRDVEAVVNRHAERISHVVLATASHLATTVNSSTVGVAGSSVLVGRIVAAEQRRLARGDEP